MSSSAPETCSASDDFEKNSLGRYGIQLYQFEPRVDTGPGGVLYISLGGEVRHGPSYPDPV